MEQEYEESKYISKHLYTIGSDKTSLTLHNFLIAYLEEQKKVKHFSHVSKILFKNSFKLNMCKSIEKYEGKIKIYK